MTATEATTPAPIPPDAFGVPALDPHDADAAAAFLQEHGFVLLRAVFAESFLVALGEECARVQREVAEGRHPERHGGEIFVDDDHSRADERTPFVNYVSHVTELSPLAAEAAAAPAIVAVVQRVIGPHAWLLDDERFGVVYQDARLGRESGYSRIGWHSDWQSGPHLAVWPSTAFTVHLDATSPANGFLRVVPGSHRRDPAGMPPAFERVDGEVAVYAGRGDVILHDAHLWHSASRATADDESGIRRHLRGGWYGGTRLDPGHDNADFVKNAAR